MNSGRNWNTLRQRFEGRLSERFLDLALDYVRFGEGPLALETLCDYVLEEAVSLSAGDFEHLMEFNASMQPRLSSNVVAAVKRLIKSTGQA